GRLRTPSRSRLLSTNCNRTGSMALQLALPKAALRPTLRILLLILGAGATGCTTQTIRTNPVRFRGVISPQTIQVMASSSLSGRPMGEDPSLSDQVSKAFQKQFPGAQLVQSEPEMVVFFTIVSYVPGCSPDCKKFETFRNWTCEVIIYPRGP